MEVHKALPTCINNGIKVYPVHENGLMYVVVENNGKIKRGKITHTQKTIDKAIKETLVYLAQKLEK